MRNKKHILDLVKERVVILDGAMGSLLINQGLQIGIPPESWNVTNPEKVQKIHLNYYNAGSDVVLTNTFGGSRLKLSAHNHGERVEEYNIKAVEIAREICPEEGYVAGDVGPSGKFLPPVGKVTLDDFEETFLEQTRTLANAEVDFFFIETMVDLKEAESAVKAAKRTSNLPIFVSITYKKTKRGYFTIMGNSVDQCVNTLRKAGADVIGANCTLSSNEMIDLIPQIRQFTDLPIVAKPNAGKPQLIEGKTVYLTSSKDFAEDIFQMVEKEADIVGGCCGTNPQFIEKIVQRVKR